MSLSLIRQALEDALADVAPEIETRLRNAPGNPPDDEPYQIVDLLMAQPGNDEYGASYAAEGVLHITLAYPTGKGSGPTERRAQALIDAFYRGRALVAGGLVISITRTPWVLPSIIDGDRYLTPVRVTFHTRINA